MDNYAGYKKIMVLTDRDNLSECDGWDLLQVLPRATERVVKEYDESNHTNKKERVMVSILVFGLKEDNVIEGLKTENYQLAIQLKQTENKEKEFKKQMDDLNKLIITKDRQYQGLLEASKDLQREIDLKKHIINQLSIQVDDLKNQIKKTKEGVEISMCNVARQIDLDGEIDHNQD